ncbi:MAG: PAS domain-containing protein [Candidatus Hydrogenedentes bacterium]|nr:PAS domain-containing protein [Candidatus Hydrogenedentota bacterium]
MRKTCQLSLQLTNKFKIIAVCSPEPIRDNILTDKNIWGFTPEIKYVTTPEELMIKVNSSAEPNLVVVDLSAKFLKKNSFRKVFEDLPEESSLLLLSKNRIPRELDLLTQRDNVFCVPFSPNNRRHLFCTLRRIRSRFRTIIDKNKEQYIKDFIQKLFIWAVEESKDDYHRNVSELLTKFSEFFGFQVVFALERDKKHRFNLYRNGEITFCPLLLTATSISKICEDFLNDNALYIPLRFIRDEDLVFNATEETAQLLATTLKNTNTCGLCHIFDYRSIFFFPFKVEGNNWLLIFCDKAQNKASEELYQCIKDTIPAIVYILSFIKRQLAKSKTLDLYNSALASGKIGIWEYEVETRKIISAGLQSLFPYLRVPEELNEWWQYIHPEDRLNFWNAVKPCIKGLTNSFAVDHRLLLPGDRIVWIRTIGEIKEKRGAITTKLIGIGMDITAFMEKEKELRELRENFKVASEVGNIGLWAWDTSKNMYSLNESGIKLFGLETKAFYTFEDWLERIPQEYREGVQTEVGRVLSQGKSGILNVEYEIGSKNSVRKWIHTYGRVSECDSTGNPKVLSGTHIDITTQKLTEKHLMKEIIVSSRYASLARSLLKTDTIEKIAQLVLVTNLEITNSNIGFAGYEIAGGNLNIIGMGKNREIVYEENWKLDEIIKEFEFLGHSLKAGTPLVINNAKGKQLRVFGGKVIQRLLLIPSFTTDQKIVFVMDVDAVEPYSPSHMESLEWLSSVFAQSYSRVNLEKLNQQKTEELEATVQRLEATLATVRKLQGLLPICARCKRIRDDAGYWQDVEIYIRRHSDAEFTHGICPKCAKELYGEIGNIS